MFFPSENFFFFVPIGLALLGCLIYLGVGLRVLREEEMEGFNKVRQFYGYSVCLVAVITFLFSLGSLVGALFDLSDPLHSARDIYGFQRPNLASFEVYKMDLLNPAYGSQNAQPPRYVPDDQTFRAMYDSAKADKIQTVKHQARRSLTVDSVLILVSILLFALHWRLARRIKNTE